MSNEVLIVPGNATNNGVKFYRGERERYVEIGVETRVRYFLPRVIYLLAILRRVKIKKREFRGGWILSPRFARSSLFKYHIHIFRDDPESARIEGKSVIKRREEKKTREWRFLDHYITDNNNNKYEKLYECFLDKNSTRHSFFNRSSKSLLEIMISW